MLNALASDSAVASALTGVLPGKQIALVLRFSRTLAGKTSNSNRLTVSKGFDRQLPEPRWTSFVLSSRIFLAASILDEYSVLFAGWYSACI
jgi:hypothetical protein